MSRSDPPPPRLTLISGGARSGKSRFALTLAMERGERRCFVATGEAFDEEMRRRIQCHQAERGEHFTTVEVKTDLPERLRDLAGFDVIVLDCLTLYLSAVLLNAEHEPMAQQEASCELAVTSLIDALSHAQASVVVVSNEVGMGVVPATALGRVFRDVVGRANQRLAELADEVYLTALGCALRLRPEPLSSRTIPLAPLLEDSR